MTSTAEQIQRTLTRMAAGPAPGDIFAVSRERIAGEPIAWREQIGYRLGGLETFNRLRSHVDDEGAPIGAWRAPANPERGRALIAAVLQCRAWGGQSGEQMSPGMDLTVWTCVTTDGAISFQARSGGPASRAMAPLDEAMRTLARELQEQRAGVTFRIAAKAEGSGPGLTLRVALLNEGLEPAVLINPLTVPADERSYLRIEAAALPPEAPGVTSPEAEYKPLAAALQPDQPSPAWNDRYLTLTKDRPLFLSARGVGGLPPGPHMLRVVYSNYRPLSELAGVGVVRGRAFSDVVELGG